MSIKVVEIPEGTGGTVKIVIPEKEGGDKAGAGSGGIPVISGKAKKSGGRDSRWIFVVFVLIGIVLLAGASIIRQYVKRSDAVPVSVDKVQNVDIAINKQDVIVDTNVNKTIAGNGYYHNNDEGIIYDFPTAQK